jgi:hypothetical protein
MGAILGACPEEKRTRATHLAGVLVRFAAAIDNRPRAHGRARKAG